MGKFVLLNARTFAGAADLTGASNKIELSSERAAETITNFGSGGWVERVAGLADTEITGEGQWEAGDPGLVDDQQWAALTGSGATPLSVAPDGAALGELCWLTAAMTTKYQLGGEVGAVAPWTAEIKGSWPLVRGIVAHPPGTARTVTGTGTAAQLGAVPAGKHLYAALHVLSIAGTASPSITVSIESDDAGGMATPATALTFTAATAVGAQIARVAGPNTDTWFRPKWTITGTAPSFLFLCAFGIA